MSSHRCRYGGQRASLRAKAELALGKKFKDVYKFYIDAHQTKKNPHDLEAYVEAVSKGDQTIRDGIFAVDQLVYLEQLRSGV
jgi:hypothetical protein